MTREGGVLEDTMTTDSLFMNETGVQELLPDVETPIPKQDLSNKEIYELLGSLNEHIESSSIKDRLILDNDNVLALRVAKDAV